MTRTASNDEPCPACEADPCTCPELNAEQLADLCQALSPADLAGLDRIRAEIALH